MNTFGWCRCPTCGKQYAGIEGHECSMRPAAGAVLLVDSPGAALPMDSAERKDIPLCTGVFDYFPGALVEVAKLSQVGNEKHNGSEDLHHARDKSGDHADCLLRHLIERGTIDPSTGLSHSVSVVWRALAMLQMELEAAGAPKARGAR